MILGKTNHPVEIKQIPLKTWNLRFEMEKALESALKEDGSLDEKRVEQVKAFYHKISYPNEAEVTNLEGDNSAEEQKGEEEQASDDPLSGKGRFGYTPDQAHIAHARSLLADVRMDSILFFSEKRYMPGQTITVEFLTAKPFYLYLHVENSVDFSRDSRIITPNKLAYRISGRFLFPFEKQRENLRNFLTKVEPDMITEERKKKMEENKANPSEANE